MNTFLWLPHCPNNETSPSLEAAELYEALGALSSAEAREAPEAVGAPTRETREAREAVGAFALLCPGELRRKLSGQLVEVSGPGGGAGLTLAAALVRQAQRWGEPVLWLSSERRPVHPPDLVEAGVELEALPFLFLTQPEAAQKAALRALSSGSLGLLVWDLVSWSQTDWEPSMAVLGRLKAAARHHRACVVLLSDKPARSPSAGPLVGVRLQAECAGHGWDLLEVRVVKDKRSLFGEGRCWRWRCRLPDGLPASAPLPAPAASPPAA